MLSHYGTISKYPGKDVLVEGKEEYEENLNENNTIAFFDLGNFFSNLPIMGLPK